MGHGVVGESSGWGRDFRDYIVLRVDGAVAEEEADEEVILRI
jgi:hypothetical protein